MSFPAIDTSIKYELDMSFSICCYITRNGSGKTAADVACTRLSNAMDSSLRTRIQEIINGELISETCPFTYKEGSSLPGLASETMS